MDVAESIAVEAFMRGPLVTWFTESFLEPSERYEFTYDRLVDGVMIHRVFSEIISIAEEMNVVGPSVSGASTYVIQTNGDPNLRQQNLARVLDDLRRFYESEHHPLFVYFVAKLPDLEKLSEEPQKHTQEAKKLLCLLLGCWQWVGKYNTELKDRWDKQANLTQDNLDAILPYIAEITEIEQNFDKLKSPEPLQQLIHQNEQNQTVHAQKKDVDNENLLVKMKDQKKEIEKKNLELMDEIELKDKKFKELEDEFFKLKEFNEKHKIEAKLLQKLQDEKDELLLKTDMVEQLEKTNKSYEKKLSDLSCVKNRLKEMELDNDTLRKNNALNEELVKTWETKNKSLETKVQQLNKQIIDLTEENASLKRKCEEATHEMAQLTDLLDYKSKATIANDSHEKRNFSQSSDDLSMMLNGSISDQLSSSIQSENLKLQLENRRLSIQLDEIKEHSDTSSRIVDLEAETKRLQTKIEKLQQERSSFKDPAKTELLKMLETERKRSADFQYELKRATKKLEDRKKALKDSLNELSLKESKISALESEKKSALKEAQKQRLLAKEKSVDLQKSVKGFSDLESKVQNLEAKLDESKSKKIVEFINDNNDVNTIKKSPKNKIAKEGKASNEDQVKLENLIKAFEPNQINNKFPNEKNNIFKSREKSNNSELEILKKQHEKLKKENQDTHQELRRLTTLVESLETAKTKFEDECKRLRQNDAAEEHEKLKQDFEKLFKSSQTLMEDYRRIKAELGKLDKFQEELKAKTSKIIELEIHLKAMTRMNQSLEQDKKDLMLQTDKLVIQMQENFNQATEDREFYYEEDRRKTEEYNKIFRQKEKLEEKIIELHRNTPNAILKKKNSNRLRSLYKMSKFWKSRRSLNTEDRTATELSQEFEFRRNYVPESSLGKTTLREISASDFTLNRPVFHNKPRTRNSVDIVYDSAFPFDCSKAGRRKSIDWKKCDEELNRALQSTTILETSKEDLSNNKADSTFTNNCCESNEPKCQKDQRPDSRASVWSEAMGCA